MKTFSAFIEEQELLLMANLSPAEMLKYDWRVDVFIDKYQRNDPFEIGGKQIKLKYEPAKANVLKKKNRQELAKLEFLSSDEKKSYKLTNFTKNKEFGGLGIGSGTVKEDRELSSLIKQIENLKSIVKKSTVPIRVGRTTYEISTAASTPGTPKSDFHLIDIEGNEVVWISHKDGKTAKDFQQWGGMSERAESAIYNHKESQSFINDVRSKTGAQMPSATTYARKITSERLKNLSIYGNQYGKKLGRQNVSILLQGPVKLVKKGSVYLLDSNHVHLNGEKMTGDFVPVFMAIYKGDRSNFGIRGARFAIQPLGSRKVTEFI